METNTFKPLTEDEQLEFLGKAERFISWFRQMNIEGQIEVSDYAKTKNSGSDFDAVTGIRHCMANIITQRQARLTK